MKTSSLPISPRVFENAKFGSNNAKKSNNDSYNEATLSNSNNIMNTSGLCNNQ